VAEVEDPGLCALQGWVLTMKEVAAIILFLLAVFGVANAVAVLKTRLVFEALFGRIWILKDLIKCPPCIAFWTGMACSKFLLSPASAWCGKWWAAMLVDGFAALGAVWLLHLKAERLGSDPAKALDL
jgi:hypothetical protein